MTRIPPVDPTREHGPVTRALHAIGMSAAGRWFGINVGSRVDPALLRITGGRFATTSMFPLVLLGVRGRRSGELRTVPLVYFTDGEGQWPRRPPPVPVLWVLTRHGRAAFGCPFGRQVLLRAAPAPASVPVDDDVPF